MHQSKKTLLAQIESLKKQIEQYRRHAVGTAGLRQCKSNMCFDCKYALISEGGCYRTLFGCTKDCLCEDYDPVSLRAGNDNRNDRDNQSHKFDPVI